MPQSVMLKNLNLKGSMKTYKTLQNEQTPNNNNSKKMSISSEGTEIPKQEVKIYRETGKFELEVQNEAGQRLTEFCQENTLVIANPLFQQHKRKLYTWTSPEGQYQNQIDYILCSRRWRSSIQSAKTRPGVDCGSEHELLTAKFSMENNQIIQI